MAYHYYIKPQNYQETWKETGCMQPMPSPLFFHSGIYQRSISEWEKQFGMQWRRFLESKKYIWEGHKVMLWNDSACMESFRNAESRFWAKNPSSKAPLPSPDMYIDQIDWNCEIDPQHVLNLEFAWNQTRDCKNGIVIPLEQIKPTGLMYQKSREPNSLTGMAVGDNGSCYKKSENWLPHNVPMKFKKMGIDDQGANYSKFATRSNYQGKSARRGSYMYRPVSKPG